MNQKKKVSLITLGCKVNTYEAEAIGAYLFENGYNVVSGLVPADIYILSSCAVTNEAERKSRGQIAKILKINPNADIYVCGCAAQHDPNQFLKFDNVKYAVGTNDKLKIAKLIMGKENSEDKFDIKLTNIYNDSYESTHTRTRAVIKVQDGCNNFCSYCLIPYLRGRERSRSLTSIKNEIERLTKSTKEIVLAGINLSSYGNDFVNQNISLIDVAELFAEHNVKFRFSSLEVNIITDDFLRRLRKLNNFQPHFHLSMQSASDNVLKKMNRHYTISEYMSKVDLIRKYFPDAGITTDVIVTFPNETEEDFNETYKNCQKIGFLWMHVFPFSPRGGTAASKMKNINDGNDAKIRVNKLTDLANKMRDDFVTRRIGREYLVIIEQEKDGLFVGHTPNFIKCYVKSCKVLNSNDEVLVKITDVYKDGAIAEIVEG